MKGLTAIFIVAMLVGAGVGYGTAAVVDDTREHPFECIFGILFCPDNDTYDPNPPAPDAPEPPKEIEPMPSHEPTGYGPEDAY